MVTVVELDYIQSGVQAIFFATLCFCAVYIGLNRRWWKNRWARMIVSLDMCLWFLDIPGCLRLWFHLNLSNDFFAWYDGTTVWITALVILWRAGMIIRIQLSREEEDDGEISGSDLSRPSTQRGRSSD